MALKRALTEGDFTGPGTRSVLEDRFFDLCFAHGILRPEANARVETSRETLEVDFLWRAQRLIVETDGRAFHSARRDIERDLVRDQMLDQAGWRVRHVTWSQVMHEAPHLAPGSRPGWPLRP